MPRLVSLPARWSVLCIHPHWLRINHSQIKLLAKLSFTRTERELKVQHRRWSSYLTVTTSTDISQNKRPQCNKSTISLFNLWFWFCSNLPDDSNEVQPVTVESDDRHTLCANLPALERLLHLHSRNTCQRRTMLKKSVYTDDRKTSRKHMYPSEHLRDAHLAHCWIKGTTESTFSLYSEKCAPAASNAVDLIPPVCTPKHTKQKF